MKAANFLCIFLLSVTLLVSTGEGTDNPAALTSPRNVEHDWMSPNPDRMCVARTNQLLAMLNNDVDVYFHDIGSLFLDEQGDIPAALMTDFLHPTIQGYHLLAGKLGPVVDELMSTGINSMEKTIVAADAPGIHRLGRTLSNADGTVTFGYPGTGFRFRSDARTIAVEARSTGAESYMAVRIDGREPESIRLSAQSREYILLRQNSNEARTVEFVHQSETWHGKVTVERFIFDQGGLLTLKQDSRKKILFIGDSVACGEGAARDGSQECRKDTSWWSVFSSYGWLTGEALNAEVQLVCYGGRGLVRSWDGATNELNGPDFYELAIPETDSPRWDHKKFPADLVVVSLGTNDFCLDIGPFPEREHFVRAYVDFVKTILKDYPTATVVITDGAIVNDDDKSRPQRTVLRDYLAETEKRVKSPRLLFFKTSHFPGDKCDGHPTGPQHAAMSEELVRYVRNKLSW